MTETGIWKAPDRNDMWFCVTRGRVQIAADIDLEGLEALERALPLFEQLLELLNPEIENPEALALAAHASEAMALPA